MKNQKEIYEALLRGDTLVHDDGHETYLMGNGELYDIWDFDKPNLWSIKPKEREKIELFWTVSERGDKGLCDINGKYPDFKDKKFCGVNSNEMRKKNILKNEPSIFIDAETFEIIQ